MDFANMTQTNIRSGRVRGARRIVVQGNEESAPAMLQLEDVSKVPRQRMYAPLHGVRQEPEEDEGVWQEPDVDRQRKKQNKI